MSIEVKLHKVQSDILIRLLFEKETRFSDLNKTNLSNDHFTFHLNKLVELGLVEKIKTGLYKLTIKGKEFANRFDTEKKQFEKQAKIGVVVVCVQTSGKAKKVLVSQRLKHPFYGYFGYITGKIPWGETIYETASRELLEEIGLKADLKLIAIEHKMDYSDNNQLLEDKYFMIIRADNLTGKIKEKTKEGRNIWLTPPEILKLKDKFDDMELILKNVDNKSVKFFENKFKVKGF